VTQAKTRQPHILSTVLARRWASCPAVWKHPGTPTPTHPDTDPTRRQRLHRHPTTEPPPPTPTDRPNRHHAAFAQYVPGPEGGGRVMFPTPMISITFATQPLRRDLRDPGATDSQQVFAAERLFLGAVPPTSCRQMVENPKATWEDGLPRAARNQQQAVHGGNAMSCGFLAQGEVCATTGRVWSELSAWRPSLPTRSRGV